MAHNLKAIRQQFKERGVFYTDEKLALIMCGYLGERGRPATEVYDPTCGDGALLSVFDDSVRKYGQEIDEAQLQAACNRLTNFEGVCGDTLKDPAFRGRQFDCIMANPPFSVKWEQNKDDERFSVAPALAPKSKADFAFILHCLHYLKPDGIAAILCAPGVLYRGNAEGKIRRWLVEQNVIDRIVKIPGGFFVDTKIPTVLLILRKDRTARGFTSIVYEDRGLEKNVVISQEEIAYNDYRLDGYIVEETEPEPAPDIEEAEKRSRLSIARIVGGSLATSELTGSLFGEDFVTPLVQAIDAAVLPYRRQEKTERCE